MRPYDTTNAKVYSSQRHILNVRLTRVKIIDLYTVLHIYVPIKQYTRLETLKVV